MNKFKYSSVSLALLIPQIAYLNSIFSFASILFTAVSLFVFYLLNFQLLSTSPLIRIASNSSNLLNTLLFTIIVGLIYFYESGGMATALVSLFLVFVLTHEGFKASKLYPILKRMVIILFILALISYILYLFGLSENHPFYYDGRGIVYRHYFLVSDFSRFEILNPNTWRFYGFLNEPGAAAALAGIFLVNENYKIKGNKWLWFIVLITFSTGTFMSLGISYLFSKLKRGYIRYILLVLILIPLIYFIGKESDLLFFRYLHEKIFYITYDFFDFQEDRFQYSFLQYLSSAPIIFLLYCALFIIMPKRFVIYFLLMGLYRHHFILNTILILLPLFYFEKSKTIKSRLAA